MARARTASAKWRAVTEGTSRSSAVGSAAGAVVVITSDKDGPPGIVPRGPVRVTRLASERGEGGVEGGGRAHHRVGLLRVGAEVATDVGGLALDREQLLHDRLLVGAQGTGELGEGGGEL